MTSYFISNQHSHNVAATIQTHCQHLSVLKFIQTVQNGHWHQHQHTALHRNTIDKAHSVHWDYYQR